MADRQRNLDYPDRFSDIPACQQKTDLHSRFTGLNGLLPTSLSNIPISSIHQNTTPIVQPLTGTESIVGIGNTCGQPGEIMTPGQASLFGSILSLGNDAPALPYIMEDFGMSVARGPKMERRRNSGSRLNVETSTSQSADADDDIDASVPETILVGLLQNLTLDREAESNVLPFVAHSFTSWMTRFLFEPARVISLCQDTIVRGHFGDKALRRMILLANIVLAVSKSTDYDLMHFLNLHKELVPNVMKTRARNELTTEAALEAMESCHEFICITSKVGSLANVLKIMELYAPVFRRACPEPSNRLVNLPEKLSSMGLNYMNLKYYATFDVLQSVIAHRPMFFRYDLEFPSPRDEELINADDGPGLRWLIGAPDRLVITMARMNNLLEDHGGYMDPKMVQELEEELSAFRPASSVGPGDDPALVTGRVAVQESWRLVGYVYLYMGLCRTGNLDSRVIKIQKQFMRILSAVKPRRNPDLFLLFPMIVLGTATSSPADQSILLARLWGVSECTQTGTMGNDVVRILNDIWARTANRPAVWSDLRVACSRVIGM